MSTVIAARYQVQRVLGRGAFGSVFLAEDRELGRPVAVKLLHDAEAGDDVLARFRREAAVTARLKSPHVVRIFDHGDDEGRPFVVYQFLEGESLRSLLSKGPVPRGQALEWALQGCLGLREAHAAGVLHRDLKPENAMVRGDTGELVLCDFGLAADAYAQTILTWTEEGTPGTPLYIATEQLEGRATPASDQFTWAMVVVEMLTGQPLRGSMGVLQRLAGLLATGEHELPESARETLGDLDPPLRRALQPKPAERFPSIEALAAALEAAGRPRAREPAPHLAANAPASPPATAPAPVPRAAGAGPVPAPDAPRRALGVTSLMGLGLAGLLGLGLLVARWRPRGPARATSVATPATIDPAPRGRGGPPPPELVQAYRRLGGPLFDETGALRSVHLDPEQQAWVLDDRFPLRWRAYLRALRPWLATSPEAPGALPFVRDLPAVIGDQLGAARGRGRQLILTAAAGGGPLERATRQRKELASSAEELLGEPEGPADLVLRATLRARDLLPIPASGPSLGERVLAVTGECELLRWARHELAVAAPSDALPCETRRALLAQAEGCEGAVDSLVAAARIRAAKACPGGEPSSR